MQSIAFMRDQINGYVRSRSLPTVGTKLLKEIFGIPFTTELSSHTHIVVGYTINNVPMEVEEAQQWVKTFFENLDTTAIMDLYGKIGI